MKEAWQVLVGMVIVLGLSFLYGQACVTTIEAFGKGAPGTGPCVGLGAMLAFGVLILVASLPKDDDP